VRGAWWLNEGVVLNEGGLLSGLLYGLLSIVGSIINFDLTGALFGEP